MNLIRDYKDRYGYISSYDILETILFNFSQDLAYSDPSYQREAINLLQHELTS